MARVTPGEENATEQSARLLVFVVRHRVVLKYLGVLLLSLAPMAAVPVLVALHGEAYESANRFLPWSPCCW